MKVKDNTHIKMSFSHNYIWHIKEARQSIVILKVIKSSTLIVCCWASRISPFSNCSVLQQLRLITEPWSSSLLPILAAALLLSAPHLTDKYISVCKNCTKGTQKGEKKSFLQKAWQNIKHTARDVDIDSNSF